jgi:hypothetical protein
MFITTGEKLFGKVDRVPGHFYVATPFLFFCGIPIFPGRSYLVLEGTQVDPTVFRKGSFAGYSIYWSFKSILMAWFRALFALLSLTGGITAALLFLAYFRDTHDPRHLNIALAGTAVIGLSLGAYLLSRWLERASPQRVIALGRRLEGKYPQAAAVVQAYLTESGLDASNAEMRNDQDTGVSRAG